MIDTIDQQITTWVAQVLDDVPTHLDAPPLDDPGVSLYLFSLVTEPPLRTGRRPPLQVALHYLVTCWDDDPQVAHRQLGELLFAAMEHPDYDVLPDAVTPALWQSLSVAPRPAFVLEVIARKERPEPQVPRVQEPRVDVVPAQALRGQVVGPGGVPLVGSYVQIPILQLAKYTDSHGNFSFPNVPGDEVTLVVRAKGAIQRTTVQRESDAPLIVQFESFDS